MGLLGCSIGLGLLSSPSPTQAQNKFFATPNRGIEGGKGNAQIKMLMDENSLRRTETASNAASVTTLDGRVNAAENDIASLQADMADIEPHAKAALSACSSAGKVLRWDGSAWSCADETDPTVGPHALATEMPPFCHEINAKLIWSTDGGGSWKCAVDQAGVGGITAEDDPQVGVLMTGKWCTSNGSQVVCASDAPSSISSQTINRLCRSDGATVRCDSDAPSASSGNLAVTGSVTAQAYYHSSDAELKKEIHQINDALESIRAIRGVTYKWKSSGEPAAGVIAQEVKAVLPYAVRHGDDGYLSVEYDQLIPFLVESIRVLDERIKLLEESMK